MASYRARFLQIMAANERTMSQLFRDLAAGIAADVARRADADGVVPRTATFELQRQSAERIQRLYLGRNRAGELAPFETLPNGRVIALAPYPQALWAAITAAVRLPVEENAAILTKRLPDDILDVMRRARVDPFKAVGAKVAETTTVVGRRTTVVGGPSSVVEVEIFRPNPLATYEAPHTWVDPNGYRLSDRIWNVAAAERSRLDAYLDDSIKRGTGALTMAKELEQFLGPSRKTLTTNKPYGSKASYDAMRLARSEITQAHYKADMAASAMNPFVEGMGWMLSASHPRRDICDDYARGGPEGDGVYPLGEVPSVPHPQCLCWRKKVLRKDPDAVIASLRDDIRKARADLVDKIGPVAVENFDRLLLGETLPITQQGTRADELQSLRDRLTFTADENVATELAALNERIRAATNDRALLQQLTEERSVFLEILREREQLAKEERRLEEERKRKEEALKREMEEERRKRAEAEAKAAAEAARLAAEAEARRTPELTPLEARASFDRIEKAAEDLIAKNRKAYLSYDKKISSLYDQQTRATRAYERAKTDEQRLTAEGKLDEIEKALRSQYRERDDYQRTIRLLEEKRDRDIREVVYVRNPADNKIVIPAGVDSDVERVWRDGLGEFNKLVSDKVMTGRTITVDALPAGGRAHYKPNSNRMSLAPDDGAWVVVHEAGHWLDEQGSGVLGRSLAFLDRRTAGESLEKMSAVTGNSNYRDDELTRKDKFVEPYIGKEYRDGGSGYATEVISMGVQFLYQDPAKFARDDPDMFDFIFGVLRGR